MKTNMIKTLAVALLLGVVAVCCTKEPSAIVGGYEVSYTSCDSDGKVIIDNDEEWDVFLDRMLELAKQGCEVTIYTSASPSSNPTKETTTITYSTTSENDAKRWVREKILQGYDVSISYDNKTGVFSCVAIKSANTTVDTAWDTFTENDPINSDTWVERWVWRMDADTIYCGYPYPEPNPSWVEFRLTRYDEDSLMWLSRTLYYHREQYWYTIENERTWFYPPFSEMYPYRYTIEQDTLRMTTIYPYPHQESRKVLTFGILEHTDTTIDILLSRIDEYNADSLVSVESYSWRAQCRIERQ